MSWTGPLRDHWKLGVLVVGAGAVVGTALGLTAYRPSYRAQATLRLSAPLASVVDAASRAPTTLPDARAWLDEQIRLLSSPQVLASAAAMEPWQRAGLGPAGTDTLLSAFGGSLAAVPQGDLLLVHFVDPSPDKASAAVRCIAESYIKALDDQRRAQSLPQRKVLDQRKAELDAELTRLQEAVAAIQTEAGTQDVQRLHQSAVAEQRQIQAMLQQAQTELAAAVTQAKDSPSVGLDPGPLTAAEIGAVDPLMRQYLREAADLQRDVEGLSQRVAGGDPSLVGASHALGRLRLSVERYVQTVRQRESVRDGMAPGKLSILQIAQLDPEMRRRVREKASLQDEQDRLRRRLGPQHAMTVDTARLIAAAGLGLHEAAEGWRSAQAGPIRLAAGSSDAASIARQESLRQRERELEVLSERKAAEVQSLARQVARLAGLREQASALQSSRDEVVRRSEQLLRQAMADKTGRAVIVEEGSSRPAAIAGPSAGAVAGLGGVSGGMAGLAVFALASVFWPGRRHDGGLLDQLAEFGAMLPQRQVPGETPQVELPEPSGDAVPAGHAPDVQASTAGRPVAMPAVAQQADPLVALLVGSRRLPKSA